MLDSNKKKTAAGLVLGFNEADVLSRCSQLGCRTAEGYETSSGCAECLRELLLYLQRDDENRSVLRQLGCVGLAHTDLLPLLRACSSSSTELFDLALRVLVLLAGPSLFAFEVRPRDPFLANVYAQIRCHLLALKDAFADPAVWVALASRLASALARPPTEREPEETLAAQRVLLLVGAVLRVPSEGAVSRHHRLLANVHRSELDLLLLYLAAEEGTSSFLVLEVVHHMLKGFDPQALAERGIVKRDVSLFAMSTFSAVQFAKCFSCEFLKCYNMVVTAERSFRQSQVHSKDYDDATYLWTLYYFMRFNRLTQFQPKWVTKTVNAQTLRYLERKIELYRKAMLCEKSNQVVWAKRLLLGLGAYREVLETLKDMDASGDDGMQNEGGLLACKIFYLMENKDLLYNLFRSYDRNKFPVSYLSELVETTFTFITLYEMCFKKNYLIAMRKNGCEVPQRKFPETCPDDHISPRLRQQWEDIARDLCARLGIPQEQMSSDDPDVLPPLVCDNKQMKIIVEIKMTLAKKDVDLALKLLYDARQLYPESHNFGSREVKPHNEVCVLRKLFLSDVHARAPNSLQIIKADLFSSDSEYEIVPPISQRHMRELYERYASVKLVQPCCTLLANYDRNSYHTNYCLVKLLQRLARNCPSPQLFFRASLFVTFQKAMKDPFQNSNPIGRELCKFAKQILGKFFEAVKRNDKLIVDLLFWKEV